MNPFIFEEAEKKYRIVTCVLHSCIRTHKQGWMLLKRGHHVQLLTEKPLNIHGWQDYNSCTIFHSAHLDGKQPDVSSFARSVKSIGANADVIICSNEPDWLPIVVRQELPNKPIIFDIHDMVSVRTGTIDTWEKQAQDAADGFLVPSAPYKKIMQERYPEKPCQEVQSCVPFDLFPQHRRFPQRHGIVYEGGLKGIKEGFSDQFQFRSWAEFFRQLALMNIEVWAYPAGSAEDYKEYEKSGVIMMPTTRYDMLLSNLASHEVGLVGSPFPSKAFDGALPNKMFEYIAAGLPIIAFNAPTVKEFIDAYGFGKAVDKIEDIPAAMNEFEEEKIADYVWEMRKYHCMERQINKVDRVIEEVINHQMFLQSGTP